MNFKSWPLIVGLSIMVIGVILSVIFGLSLIKTNLVQVIFIFIGIILIPIGYFFIYLYKFWKEK